MLFSYSFAGKDGYYGEMEVVPVKWDPQTATLLVLFTEVRIDGRPYDGFFSPTGER